MEHVLFGLRDVQGVVGSFVADVGGTPLAASLPQFIGHVELTSAVARIASVIEALGELEPNPQSCTLYFQEHRLYVQLFAGGCLGIIAEPFVNVRALRMASRLAQRKLQRMMQGLPESGVDSGRTSWLPQVPSDSHLTAGSFAGRYLPRTPPPPSSPPLTGYEMHAHGTLPMNSTREHPMAAVHRTQPSMATATAGEPNMPVSGLLPSAERREVVAPEARGQRRAPVGRTMVYRGRRYEVPQ